MNIQSEDSFIMSHPQTHVIIRPGEMPATRYTKRDRRRDIFRFIRHLLTYIGFVILMLGICIGVSILLINTKWFEIWMMVVLFLGWLTSAVRELFFD